METSEPKQNLCTVEGCGHSMWDHGRYEWLKRNGSRELVKVSEGCTVLMDLGGDQAERCKCERYREREEEEPINL